MGIFNSLGSNYSSEFIHRSLMPAGKSYKKDLTLKLKQDYKADEVFLTYKGREAITLLLRQLQLPEDSYVAINGYTCYVVYAAVIAAGLKPYLLDISKDNLNFSASTLASAVLAEPKIRAVIIQNTLGMPAAMSEIDQICKRNNIALIEDLAHSAGLRYPSGELAGTIGQATALSFSQDKIIDAVSGGAALLFQPKALEPDYGEVGLWQRMQAFWYPCNSFIIRKTHSFGVGKLWLRILRVCKLLPDQMAGDPRHYRKLPNRQAGLALLGIEKLPDNIAHRRKIASIYQELLPRNVKIPHQQNSVYIRFPLLVDEPRGLETYLKQHDIFIAQPWYDAVIAPGKYMPKTDYKPGDCPNAEYVAAHIINLPTHINISEAGARVIAGKVSEWLSK